MTTALARSTDPDTSREAALMVESGALRTHCAQVLAEVRLHPYGTSAEIAAAIGMDRVEAARRLPNLRDAGDVVNGPKRRCRITGNNSITWVAKDAAL